MAESRYGLRRCAVRLTKTLISLTLFRRKPPNEGVQMSDQPLEGGCQCGAVRYRISGEPLMAALCHCSMCRRANAAPAVAWAMYRESQVGFPNSSPAIYESSPGSRRGFCPRCGSQISFTADYIFGLIDITIGSLDEPNRVAPTFHYWESKRLPWLQLADELPRHAEFPPTA